MADSRIPPCPTVRNEHEWKQLSAEQQASAIHEWQKFWMGTFAPSAIGVSGVSFSPLAVVPVSANDNDVTIGGKLRPTKAELEGTENDEWKRY